MKTSAELRTAFLEYFRAHDHEVVASSPLVPANDPTLLFTNAGMVQFKDVFLGTAERAQARAVSAQRCVRAGGKHNDLENVGYTARHHTFFEMLGNFSFGDYFKPEAIRFAWEFLTDVLHIPAERLWITVYTEDHEAADIWLKQIGVPAQRLSRCGESSNFWSMGDTGPCGPCTEIFYDHGPGIAGGPPGSPDEDGDRYVEIWNLVFMQYERDAAGRLTPMSRHGVDTGMGLERLAAVVQGVHSNYDTDLFRSLIDAVRSLAGAGAPAQASLQVVADHIRSCAFLVADGVRPSNEGRGYVLRRIIRRAVRHGRKLGIEGDFFHRLVARLEREMGAAYPELSSQRREIERVLAHEEVRFGETLVQGLDILDGVIGALSGAEIPGDTVFQLYDTFGFPVDLTADIARERGLTLDMAGFDRAMSAQRERARAASQFAVADGSTVPVEDAKRLAEGFEFIGYDRLGGDAKVLGLYRDGAALTDLGAGDSGIVVLDRTPFYAESGGQIGDRGTVRSADAVFEVVDTLKQGRLHLHAGTVKLGTLVSGARVRAQVDAERREPTRANHSATHLLHAALRRVLGAHVTQKGSLVAPERLRFDFSHPEPVSRAELDTVEALVNAQVRANLEVDVAVMAVQQALDSGAMALFGEKYDDQVRVLRMGEFSMELCGGTHVRRTGEIGLFRIVAESGVASGVRRIEAVTGSAAVAWTHAQDARLRAVADLLKASRDTAVEKVEQLVDRNRRLEKEVETLKARLGSAQSGDLASAAVEIEGVKVLAARIDGLDAAALRANADRLRDRLGRAALVLGTIEDGKVRLVATVTKDLTARLHAGELVNHVAGQVGGKGGGRPDLAQAGGTEPAGLDAALRSVPQWVSERLG
ncbi:MAG: alanine--tRNA ligase [Gammaproteobacteria bacterium]|nr:alanine--tRNA ligase [Gammaproteobacteria bacterium]